MQGILEQNLEQNAIAASVIDRTSGSFGEEIGIIASLFGCWHKRLTRPISDRNSAYCACLECGARKKFNTESFETSGPFYYPPSVSSENM